MKRDTIFNMEQITLSNTNLRSVVIDIKKINDKVSLFKAVLIIQQGEDIVKEHSEGIAENQSLEFCKSNCSLPQHNSSYKFVNEELLDLVRIYGYPDSLDYSYFEKELGFSPLKRMEELEEENKIAFDDFKETDIPKIVHFISSSYSLVRVCDNKVFPVGLSAEILYIDEYHYNNFDEVVSVLLESKRLTPLCNYKGEYIRKSFADSNRHLTGKIALTNEEYDEIRTFIQTHHSQHIHDDFYIDSDCFKIVLKSFDFLGIAIHEKTEEEKENE